MRPITFILAGVLALSFAPSVSAHEECTGGDIIAIDAGVRTIYVVSTDEGETMVFVESNGEAGIQCEGDHPSPDMRLL